MRKLFLALALGVATFTYGQTATEEVQQTATPEQVAQLTAGGDAALAWLNLLDRADYRQSLVDSSELLRSKITVQNWTSLMKKKREPLGRVVSRKLIDGNFSNDPAGLPAGLYIWVKFNTSFSNGSQAVETLTLRFENGAWKVMTYQN